MRLSGIDPGIIRELSGIYKPFVKAFKELVSNAYDADAKKISVAVDRDLSSMEVLDDGIGMTPFDFQKDFARLGGSTARQSGGKSPGGRFRIGYKGIGFLAVARYCGKLTVETRSAQLHRGRVTLPRMKGNRTLVPFGDVCEDILSHDMLRDRLKVLSITATIDGKPKKLKNGKGHDFEVSNGCIVLGSHRAKHAASLDVEYDVDCRGIVLSATLDFDYLLSLADRGDLRLLEDFCTVNLRIDKDAASFTRIRLHGLKEFVVRELGAPSARGRNRNIASKGGREQFLWKLARCSPIRDHIPEQTASPELNAYAALQQGLDLPALEVAWRGETPRPISRDVYLPGEKAGALDQSVIPVNIDERGLRVTGYLLARSEVIFPAELRGISVRVRNVAIGDAAFFGWEHFGSGPARTALGQITGELLVQDGLQAADAINPGRESFYEENDHFRTLKRILFGSGETLSGLVGQAVQSIINRAHIRSQVKEKIAIARERRRTLAEISSAVNFYIQSDETVARGLDAFFASSTVANGLESAKEVPLGPGPTLAGFSVDTGHNLGADHKIDYMERKVVFDEDHDVWDTTVYLNGIYYAVVCKQGRPDHPVCEFDNEQRKIYVNWAHPAKLQMDDVSYLKSAILLKLANYASPKDADAMLNLAFNMLAFRAE